jgi:hypothetical protein
MFNFNKASMIGLYGQQKLPTQKLYIPSNLTVSYLIIGGGGGGAHSGGGAGGVLQGTTTLTSGIYNIIVGSGGAGSISTSTYGGQGGNTIFNNLTAYGGGAGSSWGYVPSNGGSGSGASTRDIDDHGIAGGSGVVGQGQHGGGTQQINSGTLASGGGGGAGGNGSDGNDGSGQGGDGGIGITSDITGFSTDYAGGGGGAGDLVDTYGRAPYDGGGNASYGGGFGGAVGFNPDNDYGNAQPNTGGGGGGAKTRPSGNGADGIVVISYPGTTPKATGGDLQYTIGGNYIHVFENTGLTNPLAYWKLDETSGTRYDSKGSNNLTAHLSGGFNLSYNTGGIIGNCLSMGIPGNGVSDYLQTSSTIDFSKDYTISVWAKRTGTVDDYCIIFDGNSTPQLFFGPSSQPGLYWVPNNSYIYIDTSNPAYPANDVWYHYVCIAKSNYIYLYINGTQVAANNVNGLWGSTYFYVGAENVKYPFQGLIDEIGIWQRVLSIEEIQYLYNSGAARNYPFQHTTALTVL